MCHVGVPGQGESWNAGRAGGAVQGQRWGDGGRAIGARAMMGGRVLVGMRLQCHADLPKHGLCACPAGDPAG